jgi:membrane fusion protein
VRILDPAIPQLLLQATPVRQLFRQQAVKHAGAHQYGTVILARSISHLTLTAIFIAVALGIVAFFAFFSTTRKAQSQGVLLPTAGVIRVLAGQGGVVREVRITEGKFVHEGEVLFVLSSERSATNKDSPERIVTALLQSRRDSFGTELLHSGLQSRQRAAAAQQKILGLTSEIERMGDQLAMQRQRVSLAQQAYKRFSELQATNYISAAQLQDKQGEVLDQRQRLADIQRIKSATERELAKSATFQQWNRI